MKINQKQNVFVSLLQGWCMKINENLQVKYKYTLLKILIPYAQLEFFFFFLGGGGGGGGEHTHPKGARVR